MPALREYAPLAEEASFLSLVGEHLYGPSWRSSHLLGAALDVNPRRVRAWVAGEEPVPEGVWRELYEMLRQEAVENARLSYELMRILYPNEEHI